MHTWFRTSCLPVSRRGEGMMWCDSVPIHLHRICVQSIRLPPISTFQQRFLTPIRTNKDVHVFPLSEILISSLRTQAQNDHLAINLERNSPFLNVWLQNAHLIYNVSTKYQYVTIQLNTKYLMVSEVAYMANALSHRNVSSRNLPPDLINMTNPERDKRTPPII